MKYIVSNPLYRIGAQSMNNYLVIFIKREVFDSINNDAIMQQLQNMRSQVNGSLII